MKTLKIFSIVFIVALFFGQCNRVECLQVCRELSEQERQLTPYQLNDRVYFTDVSDTFSIVCIEINTKTVYYFDEGVLTLKLYDNDWCAFDETYSYFSRKDNPYRLFMERVSNPNLPPAYHQVNLVFREIISLEGALYKNVNIICGNMENFDSVYYNNQFGIIRMVNDSVKLNIIR